ncbi:DUF2254 domain-containing protein [Thalassiella azotivora]
MNVLQRLRERFWFVPAALCLVAAVLAELLVAVDESLRGVVLPRWVDVVLYRVGESGSRDVLGAIASSSLAVAGTTFSITMAVLALTSSSYGPRLVRNFMADRGNQVVLGVYTATFLYSLLVLRSVRVLGDPGDQDAQVFVPHLAVNVAVLLAVANVGVLVYFIHHISDSIQVSTLAREVRTDLRKAVDLLYPADIGDDAVGQGRDPHATPPGEGAPVTSGRAGYVRYVDEDDLMAAARRHDVVVGLRVRPGRYVVDDTVVATVHPASRHGEDLQASLRGCLDVGDARSPYQDVEFAVQQLTEMAVRALSPGTNDPYTAVNALDDLSAGLAVLVSRRTPSPARYDDDGALRVHAPRPTPAELVTSVLDAVRWYALSSPSVVHAALRFSERVGRNARDDEVRRALAEQVELLRSAFAGAGHQAHDVAGVDARVRDVRSALLAV